MLDGVLGLSRDQLAVGDQADRAISRERELGSLLGSGPSGRPATLGPIASVFGLSDLRRFAPLPGRHGLAQERVELVGPEITLADRDDLASRGDEDRRRQPREVEAQRQLLVHVGTELQRDERSLRVLDDRRHPGTSRAPSACSSGTTGR